MHTVPHIFTTFWITFLQILFHILPLQKLLKIKTQNFTLLFFSTELYPKWLVREWFFGEIKWKYQLLSLCNYFLSIPFSTYVTSLWSKSFFSCTMSLHNALGHIYCGTPIKISWLINWLFAWWKSCRLTLVVYLPPVVKRQKVTVCIDEHRTSDGRR